MLEPLGENGRESTWTSPRVRAHLAYDCHRAPRKLVVTLVDVPMERVLSHVAVFGAPVEVSPGALSVVDRDGFFRLHVVPGQVHATLRKSAGRDVVARLLLQLRRAAGEVDPPRVTACPMGALATDAHGAMTLLSNCTRCLECVPAEGPQDAPPPAEED